MLPIMMLLGGGAKKRKRVVHRKKRSGKGACIGKSSVASFSSLVPRVQPPSQRLPSALVRPPTPPKRVKKYNTRARTVKVMHRKK